MRRIALVLVVALTGAGCHDRGSTTGPVGPRFELASTGSVQQVFGGGTVVIENVEGLPRGTYTFHAVLDAAGQAHGQAQLHFATSNTKVHIDIRCVAIQQNEAWLSGPVTSSTDPALLGKVMEWRVQDNGEGDGAPADRTSGFGYLGGSDNLPPDICLAKDPLTTRPWSNGSVRIRARAGFDLWDMVGTWDVTKFICVNLANPADTQSIGDFAWRERQTVAPNGHFTTVWWIPGPPGRIVENTRGWMEVVNGVLRISGGGMNPVVIEATAQRTGNVGYVEFDGNVCKWDGSEEEGPSHVVAESRLKRTGTLVDDLWGTWTARVYRYTSQAHPGVFVDQVAQGISITLTLGLDSHYTLLFQRGQQSMQDEGEMIFEGNEIMSRRSDGGDESAGTFEFRHGVFSFTGAAAYDFDGDGPMPPEPAVLSAEFVRP